MLAAITCNIWLNLVLRVGGAKRAYGQATWLGEVGRAPSRNAPAAAARHVAGLVNHVSSVFPARSACLVRSLTLRTILLRRGIESEVRLGARQSDGAIAAHAWLEIEGRSINDSAEIADEFVPFPMSHDHWSKIDDGGAFVVTRRAE